MAVHRKLCLRVSTSPQTAKEPRHNSSFEKIRPIRTSIYSVTSEKINITDTIKNVEATLRDDKSISPQVRVMMELLLVVINLLLNKLGLNSKNSSTPPSKDPKRTRGSKRKTEGEKRKPGG